MDQRQTPAHRNAYQDAPIVRGIQNFAVTGGEHRLWFVCGLVGVENFLGILSLLGFVNGLVYVTDGDHPLIPDAVMRQPPVARLKNMQRQNGAGKGDSVGYGK
jgi:hypothetical protein